MSVEDGRKLWDRMHRRYTEDALPATDTQLQRAELQYRAMRGDQLARKALEHYAMAQAQAATQGGGDAA